MFNFFMPKPYRESYLPEEDGHGIYFAEYGNPKGEPVIITHGGPGYYSRPSKAKLFDKKKYRVIMFDQRGCGKSKYKNLLKNNTTKHTLQDITRLLEHLKIKKKVILQGTSFGSTISLLYAQKFPDKVKALILEAVYLARNEDFKFFYEDTKNMYPEFHEEMVKKIKSINELERMINSNNEDKQLAAIKYFYGYEFLLSSMNPSFIEPSLCFLNGAKIAINYLNNKMFLEDNQIIKNTNKIEKIKTLILHNRLDLVCPIAGAYELYKNLKNAKFLPIPDFGHGGKLMRKTLRHEIKKFLT